MGHRLRGKASALVLCGCAYALGVYPAPARAYELSGGVSVGGIQIGADPRLTVSPFAGLLWHRNKKFILEVHNMFSILPGERVGDHDRTAAALGYAWETGKASLGPSLSIYWMPVCGVVICRQVLGIAPGGHAQVDWYFFEYLGLSVGANLDWVGGSSRVLRHGLMGMATAGPVWRFDREAK